MPRPARSDSCACATARSSRTTGWLIQPPAGHDRFFELNTRIHGIRAEDVVGATTLEPSSSRDLAAFAGADVLVAHNAGFDMTVLRRACEATGDDCPPYRYACSLQVARKRLRPRLLPAAVRRRRGRIHRLRAPRRDRRRARLRPHHDRRRPARRRGRHRARSPRARACASRRSRFAEPPRPSTVVRLPDRASRGRCRRPRPSWAHGRTHRLAARHRLPRARRPRRLGRRARARARPRRARASPTCARRSRRPRPRGRACRRSSTTSSCSYRELAAQARHDQAAREERERREQTVLRALAPVQETLQSMQRKVDELERDRQAQFGSLAEQLRRAQESDEALRATTESLASALRSGSDARRVGRDAAAPRRRGRRARRGTSTSTCRRPSRSDAGAGRPDMVIRLPGDKAHRGRREGAARRLPRGQRDPVHGAGRRGRRGAARCSNGM